MSQKQEASFWQRAYGKRPGSYWLALCAAAFGTSIFLDLIGIALGFGGTDGLWWVTTATCASVGLFWSKIYFGLFPEDKID